MTNIEILYNYENKAEIEEVVEVLVELGKLNYCVDSRVGKGYLKIKKVHQEVVSIKDLDSVAESEKKITTDSAISTKTSASPAPLAPMPHVHRIGEDYIVAYTEYDAVSLVSRNEGCLFSDTKKKYKNECTPLNNHAALLNEKFIGNKFRNLLQEVYSEGVGAEWIDGEMHYKLPFDLVVSNLSTDTRYLAFTHRKNGGTRVVYSQFIGDRIEEYLSGKGE